MFRTGSTSLVTDQALPEALQDDVHTMVWLAATEVPMAFNVTVTVPLEVEPAASVTPFT
jgi:hypothetical protein